MRMLFHLGVRERWPMGLQILALVCILAVGVMSTAQITHTHTGFSTQKQQGSQHNNPASDDHCPLCVAMHSAFAVPQHFTPEPALSIQRLDSVAAEAARIFRWRFEMACRPPPAQDYV